MNPDPHNKPQSASSTLHNYQATSPIASWIFGGLILAFLMIIVFAPVEPSKFPIIRFLMALSAGFFAVFFVGGVLLRGTLNGFFISATGGFVLFVLIQFVFDPFRVLPSTLSGPTPTPTVISSITPTPSPTLTSIPAATSSPTSTAAPTPTPLQASTPSPSPTEDEFTDTIKGVKYQLTEARFKGSVLLFWFIAKNQGANKQICLYYNSSLTDEDGTPHRVRYYAIGNEAKSAYSTCNDLRLPFDVPTRFGLGFNTVPPTAKRIRYLRVVIQSEGVLELNYIPIPYKR